VIYIYVIPGPRMLGADRRVHQVVKVSGSVLNKSMPKRQESASDVHTADRDHEEGTSA
jgi:hypothetical protein